MHAHSESLADQRKVNGKQRHPVLTAGEADAPESKDPRRPAKYKRCAACNQPFRIHPNEIKTRTTCNLKCMAGWYVTKLRGTSNPNYRNASARTACIKCGKPYRSWRKASKFCGFACYQQYREEHIIPKPLPEPRIVGKFKCKKCGNEKNKRKPSSKQIFCSRACYFTSREPRPADYHKQWSKRNRAKVLKYRKTAYRKHKRSVIKNGMKRRNERYQTDPAFALVCRLRARITDALNRTRRAVKADSFYALTGCTKTELVRHVESTFKPGMTWENRDQWHVDHKRPCSLFDLSKPEEQKTCFHFSNLQALWALENLSKHNKIVA